MKKLSVLLGVVVAAIAASACCILPVLLGAASAGTLGLGTALAPYRPCFIALTVMLLGAAFYFTYRPQKSGCETDCCDTKSVRVRRVNKALLWLVTVFTAVAVAYPNIAAYRARSAARTAPAVAATATASTAVFSIGNMTCEECTLAIAKALKATPGVYDAVVEFAAKRASVRYDARKVSKPELLKAIENTGYPVIGAKDAAAGGRTMEGNNTAGALVILSDEAPLKEAFNQAKDKTRLLLVSPTGSQTLVR